MIDYNPNTQRDPAYFLTPTKTDGIIARIKKVLAIPTFVDGVDMSHWNKEKDFAKIKASGIDFVILKATEGIGWTDDAWEQNWNDALANNLMVMPYHFFRSNYGGAPQANWCMEQTKDFIVAVNGKTIFWNDVETADGSSVTQRQNRLLASHLTLAGNGFQSGYYSSPYMWNMLIGKVSWANDYHQWVAHWTSASEPALPQGWSREKTKFWQYGIYPTYSWAKPVEGAGTVDVNRFYGTIQELHDLLGISAPLPPDCCDEVREEIQLLYNEIGFLKGEIGTLNQRAELTEQEIGLLNQDMVVIEGLLAKVREIFC